MDDRIDSLAFDSIVDLLEWSLNFAEPLVLKTVTAENMVTSIFLGKRKQFDRPLIFTLVVIWGLIVPRCVHMLTVSRLSVSSTTPGGNVVKAGAAGAAFDAGPHVVGS